MKIQNINLLIAGFLLACISPNKVQAQLPQYNVTYIPYMSQPAALNNLGDVAGQCGLGAACLYSNGEVTYLGTLDGSSSSYAADINDSGQIVGWYITSSTGSTPHAFLYSEGKMTDLGVLASGSYEGSLATAINNAGQIVGWSYASDLQQHAVIFMIGEVIDIGMPEKADLASIAYDINDNYVSGFGQIVGLSEEGDGVGGQAFLYSDQSMTDISSKICPNAQGEYGQASAINNLGQIIGSCYQYPGQPSSFFIYNSANGTYSSIIAAGLQQISINDSGQVVGYGLSSTGGVYSFLFTNGIEYNLASLIPFNSSAIISLEAYSINNLGQIAAMINLVREGTRTILLTPIINETQ